MFVFLLLVMVLLATTELGTDSWITDLLTPVLEVGNGGLGARLHLGHHVRPALLRRSARASR